MALPKILQHIVNSVIHITSAERTAWNAKARTASPAFTGTPTAPTATAGTNNTQIANTAFVQAAIGAANPKYTRVSYSKTMASNADWVDDWCSIDTKKYNFIVVSYAGTGFSFLMPHENMYFSMSSYNSSFYPHIGSIPLEAAGVHSDGDRMQGYVSYSPHPTVAVRRDSNGIYYFSCNNKSTSNADRTMTVTAYCI